MRYSFPPLLVRALVPSVGQPVVAELVSSPRVNLSTDLRHHYHGAEAQDIHHQCDQLQRQQYVPYDSRSVQAVPGCP